MTDDRKQIDQLQERIDMLRSGIRVAMAADREDHLRSRLKAALFTDDHTREDALRPDRAKSLVVNMKDGTRRVYSHFAALVGHVVFVGVGPAREGGKSCYQVYVWEEGQSLADATILTNLNDWDSVIYEGCVFSEDY